MTSRPVKRASRGSMRGLPRSGQLLRNVRDSLLGSRRGNGLGPRRFLPSLTSVAARRLTGLTETSRTRAEACSTQSRLSVIASGGREHVSGREKPYVSRAFLMVGAPGFEPGTSSPPD
jgi:hypothetical protein